MYVKYANIKVTQSLVAARRYFCYAWEVPLLAMIHGPSNVEVFSYEWVYKEDDDENRRKLSLNQEYERLSKHLDENGQPWVLRVFGQQMMAPQTLLPLMRSSISTSDRKPETCPPIPGFEPLGDDPLARRRSPQEGTGNEFVGDAPVDEELEISDGSDAATDKSEKDTDMEPLTLAPEGYVRKMDVSSAMHAMGLPVDEAMNAVQLKNHFGEIMKGMLLEGELATDEEGLWSPGENYTDDALCEMLERLQEAGKAPLAKKRAA